MGDIHLSTCSLRILFWNCCGIQRKTEFKNHLISANYDVVCLQETLLKPDKNYKISGYDCIRTDFQPEKKHTWFTHLNQVQYKLP